MATPETIPALVAAFAFGIVNNSATAALFLTIRGHGSSTFRDGKRLVLVLFLLSAALWALVDFITTLINTNSAGSCQIAIIFSTAFDQLARLSIEQHLLWVINDGDKSVMGQYVMQGVLVGRFALGAAFVGLSKPQFANACVPQTSVFIVGILIVVVDALVFVALAALSISSKTLGQQAGRPKAMGFSLAGLAIWVATSVPMMLGSESLAYVLRTALPAAGLAILLLIVIGASGSLVSQDRSDRERRMPEAPSPRLVTTARSDDSSASTAFYPPSRYEDLKEARVNSMTAFVQPREVPVPGQQQIGVGGVPVQGQLFPPLRPEPPAPAELSSGQKTPRSVFNANKGPARTITVGNRSISNPVLQQGGTNPLDKVATTDLATALQMDKDKRAMMAAQAPAPPVSVDMSSNPESALSRATTLVRKPTVVSMPQPKELDSAPLAMASTTGAQLSPAGEELRRRSPRTSPTGSLRKRSASISRTPSPPIKSPARYLARQNGQGVLVQQGIRPSRQAPPTPEPEPAKTPLLRNPPSGLPLNPRAASVKRRAAEAQAEAEAAKPTQETVLFMNDIVYDDPDLVASVMNSAKGRESKALPPAPLTIQRMKQQGPLSAGSIVNRPRPIPRKTPKEGDTASGFYPQTNHRRSRSLGHLVQRKSILQSQPGSPTTLPPLPPPPQSAKEKRPHPNDTKSMTFDEKVQYMFPPPPGASGDRYQRRSSVPNVRNSFGDDSPTLADSDVREGLSRDSKATSVRTRDIFGEQERGSQRGVSYATYQSFIEEGEEPDSPEASTMGGVGMTYNNRRASSPVLPVFADVKSATTEMSYDADTATFSPLPIQQIGLTVHQARAIDVSNPTRSVDNRAVSAVTNSEEMTIMLDTNVAREVREGRSQDSSPMSPVDDGSPVEATTSTSPSGTWHRRVGDRTLSFSTLSDRRGSRRGPPPQPLVLNDRPTPAKQASIIRAAEPSPLPSPDEALEMLQAQLKRYENADQGSTQSPGRMALLNDLEAEMGMQETRWLGMQNEFSRDSLSTLATSPAVDSRRESAAVDAEPSLSRNSSVRSNGTMDFRASRRTRLASLMSERSSVNSFDGVPPGSRATLWQKRLADAHQEFMQSTQDLSRKPSRNFLALSSNFGSPTPPDSDESDLDIEGRLNFAATLAARDRMQQKPKETIGLWTAPPAPEVREGLMWVRPEKPYYVPIIEPPVVGLSVRPARRKEVDLDLPIESDQLWSKPASDEHLGRGLWACAEETAEPEDEALSPEPRAQSFYKPGIQRSRTAPSRPLTQRPPRRTKRMTSLPDIVEDPQPLPDKRDTLGIFQFPWGEKSDTASVPLPAVPQRPSLMAMPGTMSTGGMPMSRSLEARSREIEETEYSSSFFDDYDDDNIDDDSSSMGSDSDDEGFDESTLFEIASLLKAEGVPSTESFFGAPRDGASEVVYDYSGEPSPQPESSADRQTILVGIQEEDGLREMPTSSGTSMWDPPQQEQRGMHGKGLPQPEDWHVHDEMTETIRAKPRAAEEPPVIASDNLWTVQPLKISSSRSPMWSPINSPKLSSEGQEPSVSDYSGYSGEETSEDDATQGVISGVPMWQAQEQPRRGEHGVGLPHPEDWNSYDDVVTTARAKPRQSELVPTESFDLWEAAPSGPPSPPSMMWASKAHSAPETRAASPVRPVVRQAKQSASTMWSAPASPKEVLGSGLFEPNSGRKEFRTTTAAPAAIQMERKPRALAVQPLDRLASTTLWAAGPAAETERNWLAFRSSPVKNTMISHNQEQLLWSAPASPNEVNGLGLFDPKSGRKQFRTTTAAPAAIQMERKPRTLAIQPLDRLASTTLWALEPTAAETERNWLAFRSSPIKNTQISHNQEQLLWSAPASPKHMSGPGLFDTKSGRAEFRTTTEAPAALEMDRKSRAPERKPLEKLTSMSLWAAAQDMSQPERNWISPMSSAPQTPSTREKLPRRTASAAQWQEALDVAVAASYPPVRVVASRRAVPEATPEDWAFALAEAVSMSYGAPLDAAETPHHPAAAGFDGQEAATTTTTTTTTPFDSSRRHPVFAAASLATRTRIIHPAATGYTADVAAVHPVFFGSGAGEPAHPAVPAKSVDIVALQNTLPRQTSVRGKNMLGRISAMVSRFEEPASGPLARSPSVSAGRSPSVSSRSASRDSSAPSSRESSVQPPLRRLVAGPRAPSPEPPAQKEVPQPEEKEEEEEEETQVEQVQAEATQPEEVRADQVRASYAPSEEQDDMDAALLAQIEALEQERLFAEQWAAGSFEPEQDSHAQYDETEPFEPSPLATAPAPRELLLSEEEEDEDEDLNMTPVDEAPEAAAAPPMLLEAKTYAPSTSSAPPKAAAQSQQEQQQQQQQRYEPDGQVADGNPFFASQVQQQQQQQLKRSDTMRSAVSALSESSDRVPMRDSLVSIDSQRDNKSGGSKVEFRY